MVLSARLTVSTIGMLATCLLLTSCVYLRSVHGIWPVYPPSRPGVFVVTVSSLRPEFRWKASDIEGVTYDLGIWRPGQVRVEPPRNNAFAARSGFREVQRTSQSCGELVYYAENINSTSKRIDVQLAPKSDYFWSVRQRRGTYVGPWSIMEEMVISSHIVGSGFNTPFRFRTPGE